MKGQHIFRGRIKEITNDETFVFDLTKDQKNGLTSLPLSSVGDCELKVFDQNSYACKLTKINPQNA